MKYRFGNVCIVGLGYIGLPTAAVLASRGVQVAGVDTDQHIVRTVNRGEVHIVEPDLDVLVRGAVSAGKLKAFAEPQPADAFILAVPTPFKDDHKPDLTYVEAATRSIAPSLKRGDLVVLESTSPVGTTEKVAEWLAEARPDQSFPPQAGALADISVAHCPERVLPGKILTELINNDRVIGGLTQGCAERARDLYRVFVQGDCFLTDARTAEMCKITENSFRDVSIAFANELSVICDKIGINVWELIKLANRHPRVNILNPGPGVGGHCIAVDPWFIVDAAKEEARLIRTAREVNDSKPDYIFEKIRQVASKHARSDIACLGLSFKANIDDLRESPALRIVQRIAAELPNTLWLVEPHIDSLPSSLAKYEHVRLTNADEAIRSSNLVVLLVDHQDFFDIDRTLLAVKDVIDTRGIWG